MRALLNVLFASLTIVLCVGCGEKEVKPTLVGNWRLDGFGLTNGDYLQLINPQENGSCSVTINADGCGAGYGFMNMITYKFEPESSSVLLFCITYVYGEGPYARLFDAYLPEMNRYELKLNELKLYSADSTKKYLLYHKINN